MFFFSFLLFYYLSFFPSLYFLVGFCRNVVETTTLELLSAKESCLRENHQASLEFAISTFFSDHLAFPWSQSVFTAFFCHLAEWKLSYYFKYPIMPVFFFFLSKFSFHLQSFNQQLCPLTRFQSSYSSLSFSLAYILFESFLSISIDGCKVQRISGGSSHCSRPFRSACVPRNYPRFRFSFSTSLSLQPS